MSIKSTQIIEKKVDNFMNKKLTEVTAVICPTCKDVIFSRAKHDFHYCSCGEIAVDGGFDYVKISFKKVLPEQVKMTVNASREELYDDWNYDKNKFGCSFVC